MLYHQSMHTNFEDKKRKKHISNLIRSFHFSIFTFWSSHTIPIILYSNKHFFVKENNFIFFIFNIIIFLTTPFIPDMLSFFNTNIYIFFEQMNKTLIFQFFLFLFKNKTSSYPEKGTDKTLSLYFFRNSNTFF